MADPAGVLGPDLPHVDRRREELLLRDRVLERKPSLLAIRPGHGPVEATLAGDDDALGHVAQDRVRGREVGTDRDGAGRAAGLLPHDLTPQEEGEVVLEHAHDVAGQGAVRLAAEVRHVDRDAPAGLEHPPALGEHVAQHLQVLEIRTGRAPFAEGGLVLLAGEVRRRRDHQRDRAVVHCLHVAGVTADDRVGCPARVDGVIVRQLRRREALVERGGVVRFAIAGAERSRAGRH